MLPWLAHARRTIDIISILLSKLFTGAAPGRDHDGEVRSQRRVAAVLQLKRWHRFCVCSRRQPQAVAHTARPHRTSHGSVDAARPHRISHGLVHTARPHQTSNGLVHTARPHQTSHGSVHTARPHRTINVLVHTARPHRTSHELVHAARHTGPVMG